jgi:hypothetical protein
MDEVSDNPRESQIETPKATPTPQSDGESVTGAPEYVPDESLCPEIVIRVVDHGGLGKA